MNLRHVPRRKNTYFDTRTDRLFIADFITTPWIFYGSWWRGKRRVYSGAPIVGGALLRREVNRKHGRGNTLSCEYASFLDTLFPVASRRLVLSRSTLRFEVRLTMRNSSSRNTSLSLSLLVLFRLFNYPSKHNSMFTLQYSREIATGHVLLDRPYLNIRLT